VGRNGCACTMQLVRSERFTKVANFLQLGVPDQRQEAARIRYMERNIGLLVKGAVVLVLFYYLFFSNWFEDVTAVKDTTFETPPREIILSIIRRVFLIYVVLNVGFASLLVGMEQLSHKWLQYLVFTSGWIDGLFLAALTLVTGGFDSLLYWVFLGLIIKNAVSVPTGTRQLTLNLMLAVFYLLAGLLDVILTHWEYSMLDEVTRLAMERAQENPTEPFILRVCLLVLLAICGYGVQVLVDRERRASEEAREFATRQEQLQATGRLAAEIAHQLKNPLGIINNAAFTLQRTVKEGKTITQQIQIIREEVDRSDRILTELMGYARLSEGKVERLNITEELDRAIEQVFPPGAKYDVIVQREYAPALPPLLVQRGHLSEVFVNILQNAREAMDGKGHILVSTKYGDNYSVIVQIRDNGPGIAAEKLPKIFEPYFTTKEKGTGLGLAIVKHNTELYNGTVEVKSDLGKGTCFTVILPAKTVIKLR
jgi:signal transduction histidine kinase